ncbi:hypothetical protein [Halobellus salinus]
MTGSTLAGAALDGARITDAVFADVELPNSLTPGDIEAAVGIVE